MKRSTKVLLGIATIWQLLYMVLFVGFVLGLVVLGESAGRMGDAAGAAIGVSFLLIFVLHMITIFLMMGLLIYYIIHAVRNESLKGDMKAVWVVLFVFAGILAEPVYWYLKIWKADDMLLAGGLPPMNAANWTSGAARDTAYAPPNEPPDWR